MAMNSNRCRLISGSMNGHQNAIRLLLMATQCSLMAIEWSLGFGGGAWVWQGDTEDSTLRAIDVRLSAVCESLEGAAPMLSRSLPSELRRIDGSGRQGSALIPDPPSS